MSHYEITLSETEQKVAEYIAKKRYESARKMEYRTTGKGRNQTMKQIWKVLHLKWQLLRF